MLLYSESSPVLQFSSILRNMQLNKFAEFAKELAG